MSFYPINEIVNLDFVFIGKNYRKPWFKTVAVWVNLWQTFADTANVCKRIGLKVYNYKPAFSSFSANAHQKAGKLRLWGKPKLTYFFWLFGGEKSNNLHNGQTF